MSVELKPCPFCGGEASLYGGTNFETARSAYYVECSDPLCPVCPTTPTADLIAYKTEAKAAEAWNTRAERTCKPANVAEYAWDDFECSECGWVTWSFLMEHEGCGTVCKPRYCPNCGAKVVE